MLILVIVFAGCAIAPGHKLSESSGAPGIRFVEITPKVVVDQSQEFKQQRTAAVNHAISNNLNSEEYIYKIKRGDILNITVWNHPELTIPAGEFRSAEQAGHLVREDGTIFYPYAGVVAVANKTTSEVRELLTQLIKRYVTKPQLEVRVAAFRSQKCYVIGEVENPGPIPLDDTPITIIDAIAQAGQMTMDSDMGNVTLTRKDKVFRIDLLEILQHANLASNMVIQGGDIVHVPHKEQSVVYVLGEVGRPQTMPMQDGRMTLAKAIGDAGGVDNFTSNPGRIFVIRGEPGDTEIYHLDAKSPAKLILAENFELLARDVVFVGAAGVTRWNRVINQILPTTTVLRQSTVVGP